MEERAARTTNDAGMEGPEPAVENRLKIAIYHLVLVTMFRS
ncbi:hypothetical protein DFP91_3104 [Pseudorhodoplanes sinuspersici]|nr:hypothetical protein DFP91_3104 [Pseudorhodoplanes sinuspersici]